MSARVPRCEPLPRPGRQPQAAQEVADALRDAADFIRDTTGIGTRVTAYAGGWYDALDYVLAELTSRADQIGATEQEVADD